MSKIWSQLEIHKLDELGKTSLRWEEIGACFGRSGHSCFRKHKELYGDRPSHRRKYSKDIIQKILSLRKKRKTFKEIAEETGLRQTVVTGLYYYNAEIKRPTTEVLVKEIVQCCKVLDYDPRLFSKNLRDHRSSAVRAAFAARTRDLNATRPSVAKLIGVSESNLNTMLARAKKQGTLANDYYNRVKELPHVKI